MVWLDNQMSHHVLLNQAIIQNKVQNLINDMKAKKGEAVKDAEFGASSALTCGHFQVMT
jgi:hypothetical protein